MATERLTHRPPPDSWTAAIYVGHGSGAVLRGTGVVIGPTRILTSAHVVWENGAWLDDIWVAFPKAEVPRKHRQQVIRFLPEDFSKEDDPDIAVLEIETPVPRQVTPARLRFPTSNDLFDKTWWAFGFPGGVYHGAAASGKVSVNLANGLVLLNTTSTDKIERGFSGSGIWSRDFQAIVGIIVNAASGGVRDGDGHALTMYSTDQHLPELKLQLAHEWNIGDADEQTQAAWGWSLTTDDERGRHWSPRARGVAIDSDRGFHFRGRTRSLTELAGWLDRAVPDGKLLVVTGSPGVGKSAVLGRIVTTADADIRNELPAHDTAVRATVGCIQSAVHVKGKTALEAVREVARAASVNIPEAAEDLTSLLQERLNRHPRRFNIVVDALDEAASPANARLLVKVLTKLGQTCGHLGVQVIVGTRRGDEEGDLLDLFNGAATVIDLDDEAYFAEEDLAGYALSTLQLIGAERPGNPYDDIVIAQAVSQRIGQLAERNFLVAGLVARGHGLYDTQAVDPATMTFTPTVDSSLDQYVARLAPAGHAPARLALTVLAYAEAPGLPLPLWQAGVAALGGTVSEDQLRAFARASAANFLIEAGSEPSYRLFHQALNDALLRHRAAAGYADGDQRSLFEAFLHNGRASGWDHVNEYLLRWLPVHAARADRVDDLLADDNYVVRADLARLLGAADGARTPAGQARAKLLQRTPQAVDAEPAERAAMFTVTQSLDRLGTSFGVPTTAPYVALWANTPPRVERAVLVGHTDAVLGVCHVTLRGQSLLVSAGEDGTVRIWDPLTGQTRHVLENRERVRAVCAVQAGGQTLVASASEDGAIALWDVDTGHLERRLEGHTDWVRAICTVELYGEPLLVSVSDDRTVRLWDPRHGGLRKFVGGQPGWVTAVCAIPADDGPLLAWGSYTGHITVWNVATEKTVSVLSGHTAWVTGLTPVTIGGRMMLASCGYDGSALIWDLATSESTPAFAHQARPVTGICAVRHPGRTLLAVANEDGTVGIWDADPSVPATVRTLEGHSGWATGICAIGLGADREMAASVSEDGTVRLWNPDSGEDVLLNKERTGPVPAVCGLDGSAAGLPVAPDVIAAACDDGSVRLWDVATGELHRTMPGHYGPVVDVCTVTMDGRQLLATAGQDGRVRLRGPETGELVRQLQRSGDWVARLCAVPMDDADLLATAGDDQAVRLWSIRTGEVQRELFGHTEWVRALCVVTTDEHLMLVSASHDGTTRLWDPYSGSLQRMLTGHHGAVNAVCELPVGSAHLLATGSADHTVRLWNPDTGEPEQVLEGHRAEVTSVCAVRAGGETLLASASLDFTVRLWDPVGGGLRQTIPVHSQALSCRQVGGRLVVGLSNGMLAIELRGATNRLPGSGVSNYRA